MSASTFSAACLSRQPVDFRRIRRDASRYRMYQQSETNWTRPSLRTSAVRTCPFPLDQRASFLPRRVMISAPSGIGIGYFFLYTVAIAVSSFPAGVIAPTSSIRPCHTERPAAARSKGFLAKISEESTQGPGVQKVQKVVA